MFRLFSEDNIQIITEISENATKEYSIERILQNINQIWNDQKFETTLHKPNVFKIKYETIDFGGRNVGARAQWVQLFRDSLTFFPPYLF